MNCAGNEKLLALHAGGDLPARQARALSAHLRACEGCRRLAADFAAGRDLLARNCEPPEFDAAFFERIRRNVLSEIDDAPQPPAFARLTALLFGRRALALASCVALLVAAAATALVLRDGRKSVGDAPPQLAASGGAAGHESPGAARQEPGGAVPQESGDAPAGDARVNSNVVSRHTSADAAPAPAPRRQQTLASVRRATRARRDARPAEPSLPAFAETAAPNDTRAVNAARPDGVDAAAISEVADLEAPDERRMLRIEMQTGDPNVRIIWLTPQQQGPEKLPR